MIAPKLADLTLSAYLASTPFFGVLTGFFQLDSLLKISSSLTFNDSSSLSASIKILSPSSIRAINPPSAASGETCPTTNP